MCCWAQGLERNETDDKGKQIDKCDLRTVQSEVWTQTSAPSWVINKVQVTSSRNSFYLVKEALRMRGYLR